MLAYLSQHCSGELLTNYKHRQRVFIQICYFVVLLSALTIFYGSSVSTYYILWLFCQHLLYFVVILSALTIFCGSSVSTNYILWLFCQHLLYLKLLFPGSVVRIFQLVFLGLEL